jgi:hypothetical protein
MNQNLEEENIRRLFRETRQADESVSPAFESTIQATRLRGQVVPAHRIKLLPAVITISVLLLAAAFAVVVLTRSADVPSAPVAREPGSSDATPPAVVVAAATPATPKPARPASPSRPRRSWSKRATPLISQWRSPTDFLLKTPGNELLNTLPRVGDSSIKMRLNPDEKN